MVPVDNTLEQHQKGECVMFYTFDNSAWNSFDDQAVIEERNHEAFSFEKQAKKDKNLAFIKKGAFIPKAHILYNSYYIIALILKNRKAKEFYSLNNDLEMTLVDSPINLKDSVLEITKSLKQNNLADYYILISKESGDYLSLDCKTILNSQTLDEREFREQDLYGSLFFYHYDKVVEEQNILSDLKDREKMKKESSSVKRTGYQIFLEGGIEAVSYHLLKYLLSSEKKWRIKIGQMVLQVHNKGGLFEYTETAFEENPNGTEMKVSIPSLKPFVVDIKGGVDETIRSVCKDGSVLKDLSRSNEYIFEVGPKDPGFKFPAIYGWDNVELEGED